MSNLNGSILGSEVYQKIASMSDVVDHRQPRKPIQFKVVNLDGSVEDSVPSEKVVRAIPLVKPENKERIAEERVIQPSAPQSFSPNRMVTFISEVVDMDIPCFEVVKDEENGFLSLVIQDSVKLKLSTSQKVHIRIKGVEGFYWFTGISFPITLLGATALVFGKDNDEQRI